MANSYTTADVNQILNNPGIFYMRPYGDSGAYTKGVFTNGANFSYTPEIFTQEFDDTGDVFDAVAKETGEISFSFGKPFDLDFMTKLSGGLFTKTTTSAGAEACINQTIAVDWTDKEPIVLQLIDDPDGDIYQADGAPAITSVTASTVGALVADADYTIIPDANSYSGYSIVLNTSGGITGLATTESVVIVYNTPTVIGQTVMAGGGKKNYEAIVGYFKTILKDDTVAKIYFFKGYYNGNINIAFGTENSPEAAVTDVVISLKLDPNQPANKQMFNIVKE